MDSTHSVIAGEPPRAGLNVDVLVQIVGRVDFVLVDVILCFQELIGIPQYSVKISVIV